jgi:hypothetical protein
MCHEKILSLFIQVPLFSFRFFTQGTAPDSGTGRHHKRSLVTFRETKKANKLLL